MNLKKANIIVLLVLWWLIFLNFTGCNLLPLESDDITVERWDAENEKWFEVPSDPESTLKTQNLFENLLELRGKGMLFGQAEPTHHAIIAKAPEGVEHTSLVQK